MAIDNAEKRKAVAAIHFGYFYPAVTPNAGQDEEWRQQVGHSYSGIPLSAGPADPIFRHNDTNLQHNDTTKRHQNTSLRHKDITLQHRT